MHHDGVNPNLAQNMDRPWFTGQIEHFCQIAFEVTWVHLEEFQKRKLDFSIPERFLILHLLYYTLWLWHSAQFYYIFALASRSS